MYFSGLLPTLERLSMFLSSTATVSSLLLILHSFRLLLSFFPVLKTSLLRFHLLSQHLQQLPLHVQFSHVTNGHGHHQKLHFMILQHDLLFQLLFHQYHVHLNLPLQFVKVFVPLIILTLYMPLLEIVIVYLLPILLLSLLWILSIPTSTSKAMNGHSWQQVMITNGIRNRLAEVLSWHSTQQSALLSTLNQQVRVGQPANPFLF